MASQRNQASNDKDDLIRLLKHNFDSSKGAVFIATIFFVIIVVVCFLGQSPAGPQILPEQIAPVRVVSELSFSYTSQYLTNDKRKRITKQIPPAYKIKLIFFNKFKNEILNEIEKIILKTSEHKSSTLNHSIKTDLDAKDLIKTIPGNSKLSFEKSDLQYVFKTVDPKKVQQIFEESLLLAEQIVRKGILGGNLPKGYSPLPGARTQAESYRSLRLNISVLEVPTLTWQALFRIMKNALEPNIRYDEEAHEIAIEEMLEKVDPVIVKINRGQTLIEPDQIVTKEQHESWQAYRRALKRTDSSRIWGVDLLFLARILISLSIFTIISILLKILDPRLYSDDRKISLTGATVVINLVIARLVLLLGETQFFGDHPALVALLPYMIPTSLAPILITFMISDRMGVLTAIIVSSLVTLMMGNSMAVFFCSFTASILGVYFAKEIKLRSAITKATFISGVSLGFCASIIGVFQGYAISTIIQQAGTALILGLLTGVLVVGLIPILEKTFGIVTDISLLELSDFNHPLLRKMQLEAPGTYHHTLMVANLSESVANEIGANPMICRACSLFHDIGKLVKPAYFIENQSPNYNPHKNQKPSMSSLIIKAHIKEGVDLAQQYRLPKIIIDVIKQHHGTSLIRYFYDKARQQKERFLKQPSLSFIEKSDTDEVDEMNYRYDGPKPNFRESAIISLVDSCEAASRSLKKSNQPSVESMVQQIFYDRVKDGQLDHCPLTFLELEKMKKHIVYSLLNMLHTRTKYSNKPVVSKKLTKQIKDT